MVSHLSSRSVPRPPIKRGWGRLQTPYVAIVATLLVVGAIIVAVGVAMSDPKTTTVACAESEESKAAGMKPESADALDGVAPAKLKDAPVRVLNANGQSGQAGQVAAQLGELGFSAPATNPVGNDPLYPAQDLTCHGQIRYGEDGKGTAAALKLAAPCMQLVSDARADNTVDLALGSYFKDLTNDRNAQDALAALKNDRDPAAAELQNAAAVSC